MTDTTGAPGATHATAMRRWQGEAPAKVNLFLRVLAREDSGFHQLETLFQTLTLADRVTLELRETPGVTLEVEGVAPDALGPPEENLAVRAAHAFFAAMQGVGRVRAGPMGVHIRLEKRIPHGAGLGGGSSDAAAVLAGLNALCRDESLADGGSRAGGDSLAGMARNHHSRSGAPFSAEMLARLGAELGADVAFFLCGSPLALAWGRGDRLLPLAPLPSRPVLVAVPAPGVPTPWAYQVLAAHRTSGAAGAPGAPGAPGARLFAPGVARWRDWAGVALDQENAFEGALDPHRPEFAALRGCMTSAGAQVARLSGSGAAVFGVFETEAAREDAAARVQALFGDTVQLILTDTG